MADNTVGAIKRLALVETYIDPVSRMLKVNDSFPITPSFGAVWYRSLDFGFPDTRASSQDNPQADGTHDETQYTGARNITIEGVVVGDAFGDLPSLNTWSNEVEWNSASWFISLLSAWASPARRYRLYFTDEIGRSRFMDVRGDAFDASVEKNSDAFREFQLQMVNPSGKVYSFDASPTASADGRTTYTVLIDQSGADGRAYPETAPYLRDYPPASVGVDSIRYQGTVPTGCLIEIDSGSSTLNAPRVTFTSPQGEVTSVGLQTMAVPIPAGQTLRFDTTARTVTVTPTNATGVAPVNYAQYLAAPLQWPQIKPGINRAGAGVRGYNKVEFTASPAAAANAVVRVLYHSADLL
jgi:hypothetical protein